MLAQWQAKTHPAEVRLRKYVANLVGALSPLPESRPLFLHLDVDVRDPKRLSHGCDLENYLTPLFGRNKLPYERFVLVSAHKTVGGGSKVECGYADVVPLDENPLWSHFSMDAGSGYSKRAWRENIRRSLLAQHPAPLPEGPVAVRLAWQCSVRRN